MTPRRRPLLALTCLVALAACGSDDGDDGGSADTVAPAPASEAPADEPADDSPADDGSGDSDGGAAVVDAPPAGQARAQVEGLDMTFELAGTLGCSITDEAITYAFVNGDNAVTLGAGLNRTDDGWLGSIAISVADPDGEPGPIGYYPTPGENGIIDPSLIAVDGSSTTYTGPMLKQPANDGSNPPPVDAGIGTVSATC